MTASLTLNHQHIDSTPVPAATVVMLRPAPAGFEVLLVKRHAASGVLGGAHVFPGGKVDPADGRIDAGRQLDQPVEALAAALGEPGLDPQAAVAIHVAAIREAWEESGVLFADGPLPEARLRTRALVPWSRWITPQRPTVMQRRFDTRFFLAVVDADIEVRIDQHEAVESLWVAPAAALECCWRREIVLAAPQVMSLVHLARHPSVEAAVDDARRHGVRLIEPCAVEVDGVRASYYPGHPRHPVRERRLPGPLRLDFRDGRFEPVGGLAALLAGDSE